MMSTLRHRVRQCVLFFCLLPASFFRYPGPRLWLDALCGGKGLSNIPGGGKILFKSLMRDGERLMVQIRKKGFLCRMVVGAPLRFAIQIQQHMGMCGALRWNLFRLAVAVGLFSETTDDALPLARLCSPGPLTLLEGLAEGRAYAMDEARKLLADLSGDDVSIGDQAVRLFPQDGPAGDDFAGQTCVIMAHWDPDRRVDPYVRHMCRHFRSLGWKVVLASAAPLAEGELDDAAEWVDAVVCRTCPGYDFTSWKAALHCFPSAFQAEELVLCNDSVFGAIGSYGLLHETMDGVDCDFWGITESRELAPHLQSYYLVFRKKALAHPALTAFFRRVPLSADRTTAVNFETRLALWLAVEGLRPAAFAPLPEGASPLLNPICDNWRQLFEEGVPLIKRELLLHNRRRASLGNWALLVQSREYPLDLIFTYSWRLGLDLTPTVCTGTRTGAWPPDVLSLQQGLDLDAVSERALAEVDADAAPVGVFMHVFYPEILPEIAGYLTSLPRTAHLYVSTATDEKASEIRDILIPLGFALVEVRVLPNKGWDIAPFLLGFTDVLENYPLIVRIHAKRSTHVEEELSSGWRALIFSSLLGSADRVRRLRAAFADNPELGLVCPPQLHQYVSLNNAGVNLQFMRSVLDKHGVFISAGTAIDFPMGSMFWCRPAVLRPWIDLHLSFDDFAPTDVNDRDGSLAHAFERLFFFGCGIAGYTWGRIPPAGYNRLAPGVSPVFDSPMQMLKKRLRQYPTVARLWEHYRALRLGLSRIRRLRRYTPLPPSPEINVGVEFVVEAAAERPELVLTLPHGMTNLFAARENTALYLAAEVAGRGHNVHCVSVADSPCTTAALRTWLHDMLYMPTDVCSRFRISDLSGSVTLHANDRLCASESAVIPFVRRLGEQVEQPRFLHLMQNAVPLLPSRNEDPVQALESFDADCLPLINGPWLADFLFGTRPGRFADAAFRASALVFTPAVDRTLFHPEPQRGNPLMLFFARPDEPRHLYRYGMEALYRMAQEGRITPDWDVLCGGSYAAASPRALGNGVETRGLPWLQFSDYAAHVRQATVVMSLSLSPVVDAMTLQSAACGVPVVTSTCMNKTAEVLAALSPHIIPASPSPDAVADALRTALSGVYAREDRLTAPPTWAAAFAPVMDEVMVFMK